MSEPFAIPPAIERGFVRILSGDRPVGCGFLIGNGLVCTCAHVVAAALGEAPTLREAPTETVRLDFPRLSGTEVLAARVAEGGWRPLKTEAYRPEDGEQDIALLEVDGDLPERARPLEVSKVAKVWGHPFGAYGYPADRPGGAWASGQLLDSDNVGLIQIEATRKTGYFAQPGFSGTPVWDSHAGAVVGIITLAEPEPDKRVAFAIPVAAIERLKPGILTEGRSPIDRLSQVVSGSPPGYRSKLKDFFGFYLGSEDRPKPFGGRDADIALMNRWLFDPSAADRLLVVAPAGRGKSALLVHWAAQLPPECTVIFAPISIRYRTNRAETVFQALAARLAAVADSTPFQPAPADPAGYYMDLSRDYLDELEASGEAPIVVIVDGLDEGAGFEGYSGLFPSRTLRGVKLTVSARLTAQAPDAVAWKRNLDWDQPTDRALVHAVPGLSRAGLEDVLSRMGFPLADLAKDIDLIATLLKLTQGDPLLVGLYVEDLWSKGADAARLTPKDLENLEPGFAGYFKKWFADQRQLWGKEDPLRERDTLGVLTVLACALGPLRAAEIEQILQTMNEPPQTSVPKLVEPLQRFVIGRPDTDGYALSHPKLGEFLQSPDNEVIAATTIARTQQAFLDWGKNFLERFEAQTPTPEDAPSYEYLLTYYTSHLLREGAPVEDFMALVENGWRQAWYAFEGGYRGFANDVARAMDAAKAAASGEAATGAVPGETIPFLAEHLRCALCLSSIGTIGSRIPGDLIRLAVESGVLSQRQAINLIELKVDDGGRASAIVAVAPCLTEEAQQAEALALARVIGDERSRALALGALVPHLSQLQRGEVLGHALAAARAIGSEYSRAKSLAELATQLSEPQRGEILGEALAAARAIENHRFRAEALAALAPHVSESQQGKVLSEALAAAWAIGDEGVRVETLAALAAHLSEPQRGEVLAATSAIGDEHSRATALGSLAKHLSGSQRGEALAAARAIGDEHSWAIALSALVPHLSKSQRDDVLAEVLAKTWVSADLAAQARVLAALAPHVSESQRSKVFEAAWALLGYHAWTLGALAPHLSESQREAVLTAARASRDERVRAEALGALAPYLSESQRGEVLSEALAAARSIGSKGARAEVLRALISQVPGWQRGVVLSEALAASRAIGDEAERAKALAALATHLLASHQSEALAVARAIGEEYYRAQALRELAANLSEPQRGQLMGEALAAARAIGHVAIRQSALEALATHLSDSQLREAWAAAREIGHDYYRARALVALVPHVSESQRDELLSEALAAARAIGHELFLVGALGRLAPHLAEPKRSELISEALALARVIGDEDHRARALAALAPQLSEPQRGKVLTEALAAARAIGRENFRVAILRTLAPHLSATQRGEALAAARAIGDEYSRAHALEVLAPHLSATQRGEALAAARAIRAEHARAEALAALAPHLSEAQRGEALVAARTIGHEQARAEALKGLAPHLSEAQRGEALVEARAIAHENYRAQALAALAPHLSEPQRGKVLSEAFATTRAIEDKRSRAGVLANLAPHLPQPLRVEAIAEWIDLLPSLNRTDALRALSTLLPVLSPLLGDGGLLLVARTEIDIGKWWP